MLVGALVTAFAGLSIVGVASGISIVGRTVIQNQAAESVESSGGAAAAKEPLNLEQIQNKLDFLEELVGDYFLFEEDINAEEMEAGIYKGLLAGLGDPYTTYYTAEEYQAMTEETEGVYCGIGIQVSQRYDTGIITVLRVFHGSPAEEAGIRKGDLLYKVGDLMATEQDLDTLVSQHIRGEEGTFVDMTMMRDGEEIPVHVERRMVENETVEAQLLADKTGYVLVTQFDSVTADQFAEQIEKLESEGMERLVI